VDNAVSERGKETTRLGSFEIVRKLARGGMAEIFLARTRGPSGFEKLVVLKKVLPKYAGKDRFVQLFLEEAKLAASLDHPNIAQVYDIGMIDGSYFFTMEYLHGQDVRSILHRTWRTGALFPIEDAVQITRHVASALHFAHEKQRSDGALLGIVHRDVSPSNIIVTYDGATKLLDFGVAKTAASTVKTRTGALKGKIAYMSPEQARGAPLDRRSDIFSLGIVLWEMVTTQRLYRGENDLATLQLIINHPAKSPRSVRPDCPPELERIVMRALADDPRARYATAGQLVTDLDELAREHKLKQSSNALAVTMTELFAPELTAWREARANGVPLADHLHDAGDMATPVSESEFSEIEAILDEDDDLDELDDELEADDEQTEHVALVIDPSGDAPLYAGNAVRAPSPRDFAADPLPTFTNAPPLPDDLDAPTMRAGELGESDAPTLLPVSRSGRHAAPNLPPPRVPGSHATPSVPTVSLRPVTGSHPVPAASEEPTASLRPVTGAPSRPATGPQPLPPPATLATPNPPAYAMNSPAPGTFPAGMPDAHVMSSPPFAVPPWQAGRPSIQAPADRGARPWAIVELPAFDPVAFERRRRIVLRVAAGLVGFILLLAIFAGRC